MKKVQANSKTSKTLFSLFAALMALMLLAAPALASHKADHTQGSSSSPAKGGDRDGDADSDPGTSYTEDNDTNDGGTKNNVKDDGDNAHPSGKDRSVENGKSGNQGKSESDPDDDGRGPDRSNGGPDKPNGSGGVDKADQDGNNGCGNDDDFEDDNEGWCGKPPKTDKGDQVKGDNKPCDADETMPGTQPCDKGDEVCDANENMPAGHEKDCDEVEGDDVCEDDDTMANGEACEKDSDKITICHATGSALNPYVTITIDTNGLNGHGDHEGDIIPAPMGECGAEVEGSETPSVDEDGAAPEDTVLGENLSQPGEATGEEGPSVLGASVEAEEEGGVLPFTGGAVLPFLLVAAALIGTGVFLFRRKSAQGV